MKFRQLAVAGTAVGLVELVAAVPEVDTEVLAVAGTAVGLVELVAAVPEVEFEGAVEFVLVLVARALVALEQRLQLVDAKPQRWHWRGLLSLF